MGKQLRQSKAIPSAVRTHQIDRKIILAEFPHYLPADTAGGESTGNDAVFAAADGDGLKAAVAVIYRLKEGGALGEYL